MAEAQREEDIVEEHKDNTNFNEDLEGITEESENEDTREINPNILQVPMEQMLPGVINNLYNGGTINNLNPQAREAINSFPPKFKKLAQVLDKRNRNGDLEKEEIDFLEDFQREQQKNYFKEHMSKKHPDFGTFLERAEPKLQEGRKLLHITDTHVPSIDLENIMGRMLDEQDFNKDKDIVVHTGDLLEDLFDVGRLGLETFVPDRIVKEGRLEGKDKEDFLQDYITVMRYAGILEEDLLAGQVGKEQLQQFMHLLYGMADPRFLSKEQQIDYQKIRNRLHRNLEKAILGHAKAGYGRIREVFEELGLTPENMVLLEGNHDVPEIMREVLGDYMISPGEVQEKQGVRFANFLNGSNGQILGPHLSQIYGHTDIRKDPRTRHETKSFQSLIGYLHERGFTNVDENRLDNFIRSSQQRFARGIGEGDLAKYFERRIKPEVDHTVERRLAEIPDIDPKTFDFAVGHGDIGNFEHAGSEEKALFDKFSKYNENKSDDEKIKYLFGHEHGRTARQEAGVFLFNPGTGQSYNYGALTLDKDNKVHDILFSEWDQLKNDVRYKYVSGPQGLNVKEGGNHSRM